MLWVTLALPPAAARAQAPFADEAWAAPDALALVGAPDPADRESPHVPRAFVLLDDSVAAEAGAEPVEPAAAPQAADPDGHHRFDQGTWALQVRGSWFEDYNNSHVTWWSAAVALAYYYDDRWAVNAEIAGYEAESGYPKDTHVQVGSFTLQLRYHFLATDRYSVYLDGGAGVREADNRFPNYPEDRRGTRFGFVLRGGGGLTYRLTDHTHLFVGGEWSHMSNGHTKLNNPPADGINIYTGLMFTW